MEFVLDLMQYYGFKEDPFKLLPDPRCFFYSSTHRECLSAIEGSIRRGEMFSLITGEPGTGKTTILGVFAQKWASQVEIVRILNPRLTPDELVRFILEELGVRLPDYDKGDAIRRFNHLLREKYAAGLGVVIIVDEAQEVPCETLEELRLLVNLESRDEKSLHVILCGQPEFEAILQSPSFWHLNQRIATRCRLQRLTMSEVSDYLYFRTDHAGRGIIIFDDEARKEIYLQTGGIPRLINVLCTHLMMLSYRKGVATITRKYVKEAMGSMDGLRPFSSTKKAKKYAYRALALSCLAIASLGGYWFFYSYSHEPDIQPRQISAPHVQEKSASAHKDTVLRIADWSTLRLTDLRLLPAKEAGLLQKAPLSAVAPEHTEPAYSSSKEKVNTGRLKKVKIQSTYATVRVKPGVNARSTGYIKENTEIEILEPKKAPDGTLWYKVSLDGWIAKEVLSPKRVAKNKTPANGPQSQLPPQAPPPIPHQALPQAPPQAPPDLPPSTPSGTYRSENDRKTQ